MGKVLTTKSSIDCQDHGTASLSGSSKLKVDGGEVLLQSGSTSWTISGCTQTNTNASEVQCLSITSLSGGIASKLKVSNTAVLLENLSGMTNGTPKNGISATPKQTKLDSA